VATSLWHTDHTCRKIQWTQVAAQTASSLRSANPIVCDINFNNLAPLARIYDKTTDAFVEKENFAFKMSPMKTLDPEEPLHEEQFSLTKNRPDLKMKQDMEEQQT